MAEKFSETESPMHFNRIDFPGRISMKILSLKNLQEVDPDS